MTKSYSRSRRHAPAIQGSLVCAFALAFCAPSPAQFPVFGPRRLLHQEKDAVGSSLYVGFPAADGAGTWLATLLDLEVTQEGIESTLLLVRSLDGGETWSEPAPMFSAEWNAMPGGDSGSLLWIGPGEWLAQVFSSRPLGPGAGFLDGVRMFSRSVDNGATWSAPELFVEIDAPDPSLKTVSGIDMARDPSGTIVATWIIGPPLDPFPPVFHDTEFYVSRSFDGGRTWETPALLPTAPRSNSNCRIATAGDGRWMIAWNGNDDTQPSTNGYDTDVYSRSSSDNGATWGPATLVNSTAPIDSTTNDQFYQLASDGAGEWMASWVSHLGFEPENQGRDGDAIVAVSRDDGATWGDPVKAQALWRSDALAEAPASLHALGGGKWFATWRTYGNYSTSPHPTVEWEMATSVDGGANWANPFGFGSLAPDGAENSFSVRVATDDHSRWLALWNVTGADGRLAIYYSLGSSSQAGENATGVAVK